MYCSKCGKHIGDHDKFCSGCGSRIIPDEEGMRLSSSHENGIAEERREPYTLDTSEFVWDVHEFQHEIRRPEDVKVDWEQGKVIEIGKDGEMLSDKMSESEELKTEAVSMSASADISLKEEKTTAPSPSLTGSFAGEEGKALAESVRGFEFIPAKEEEYEHVHEDFSDKEEKLPERVTFAYLSEELEGEKTENREMKRDTARLEKFYTFNQKNEEFQKLLDREYERIKAGRTAEEQLDSDSDFLQEYERQPGGEAAAGKADTANAVNAANAEAPFDPVAHLKQAEEARNAVMGDTHTKGISASSEECDIFDNREIIKKFDTMELEKDLMESARENKKSGFSSVVLDELFGKKIEAPVSDSAQKPAAEEISIDKAAPYNKLEQSELKQEAASKEIENSEMSDRDEILRAELDAIFGAVDAASRASASPADVSAGIEVMMQDSEELEDNGSVSTEAVQKDSIRNEDEDSGGSAFDKNDEDEAKKLKASTIVLTIIIVILIFELVILGIKYFAPDSGAAVFINEKIDAVATFFAGIGTQENGNDTADGDKEMEIDNDGDGGEEKDDTVISAGQIPSADKNEVIQAQISRNKNIASITANPELKYKESVDYVEKEIHTSVPLTDNILYTQEDGTVFYVDQEAIGTLIAFDSGWIDYVNERDDAIFEVLKKGSDAYNNCAAFQKKVKKSFESLEIGEIRQGEKGYYIWAHEIIKTKNGSKTTTDEYKWVYYMEPQDGKLLIVDYYKF